MSQSLDLKRQAGGWLSLSGSGGCLTLGRVAGIPVFLHWSWFVAAWLEMAYRANTYESWAWNVAEYLALFAVVLLHEFGHAFACRSVGGRVERIVLWPLGGVASLSPPPRPGPVLWSIAAGPLVNLVLVPVTVGLLLAGREAGRARLDPDAFHFLAALTALNLALLAFNLLPFYPLDGGQMLHAVLWLPDRSAFAVAERGPRS
jgi:Zn-dependent protease